MDALERLEQAAPLLHRAVELAQYRTATASPLAKVLIKAGGSQSGSQSGSASGSDSGDDSGDTSTGGRRRAHSRGAASDGSAAGSQSGELSKLTNRILAERYMAGDRAAGIELLRRKMR
jgi:hypothetical protein